MKTCKVINHHIKKILSNVKNVRQNNSEASLHTLEVGKDDHKGKRAIVGDDVGT